MTVFYANMVHASYDLNLANTLSGNVTTLSGNDGNNILIGRKSGSFLYGAGGDDTLYIYGSGFADGGPGNDTYILLPPTQETAWITSTTLAGILPAADEGKAQRVAQGRKLGTLPRISIESTDAVYLPEVFPEDTEFRTIFYEDKSFNDIRARLSGLREGAYLVLTRMNRDYLATAVTVINGSYSAREVAIVQISEGEGRGIGNIFSNGRGARGRKR
jgi:Ca2+-binding RTX toxin-like protein